MFRKVDWFFTDFIKRYTFVFVVTFKKDLPLIDQMVFIISKN
ncbi:hypothetical protein NYQ66_08365 [Aquibacillus koreensis]|nr:hypothetical protein [Aquibacillus koreensis]MCT2535781.1 hypothetical protein [Aquibacillus koreensis]